MLTTLALAVLTWGKKVRSSPGHPPLQKPSRLLRAALSAQEERACPLGAEERRLQQRRSAPKVAHSVAFEHPGGAGAGAGQHAGHDASRCRCLLGAAVSREAGLRGSERRIGGGWPRLGAAWGMH